MFIFREIYRKLRVFNLFIGFELFLFYKKKPNKFTKFLLLFWRYSTVLLQKY